MPTSISIKINDDVYCDWIYKRAEFLRCGAGGGTRTHDPLITNQMLWPTELHRLTVENFIGSTEE